jgi:class 3 adenylate cyclase
MSRKPIPSLALRDALFAEAGRAIASGSFYLIIIACVIASVLVGLLALFEYDLYYFFPPLVFLTCLVAIATVLRVAARRQRLTRGRVYVLFIILVCLPSVFFMTIDFVGRDTAATYYHGPIATAYFGLLVFTGFFFSLRLSAVAGLAAGLSSLAVFFVARPHLLQISAPDTQMIRVLSEVVPNAMKAVTIFGTGLFVGVVARYSRNLLERMLNEEKEKSEIDRLFGEYVSTEIRERIKSNQAGERKAMAIMFSDLRNFTGLSETMEPEAMVLRLNQYFDEMVGAIRDAGGVIDKFIGDAILATFGGVLDLPRPCDAAHAAALEMQVRLAELNRRWQAADPATIPFRQGIGLHYAEVLQGVVGSSNRKEYTVIGDGVNTASRIEALCKEYNAEILLSATIYAGLSPERKLALRSIGTVQVRGRTTALQIYAGEPRS